MNNETVECFYCYTWTPEEENMNWMINWKAGKACFLEISQQMKQTWYRKLIKSVEFIFNSFLLSLQLCCLYWLPFLFFSPVHTSTSPGFLSLTPYRSHCHLWTMDTPASSSVNLSINIAWKNISLLFKTKKNLCNQGVKILFLSLNCILFLSYFKSFSFFLCMF